MSEGELRAEPFTAELPLYRFPLRADHELHTSFPVTESRDLIAALEAAGGMPRYTEYPDMGHDSWMGAYTEPDLIDWVFAQKRDDGGSRAR